MAQFIDNEPSAEFPFTIFDPVTGDIIDRATTLTAGYAYGCPVVVLRTA